MRAVSPSLARSRAGFSAVELITSTAILAAIVVLLVSVMSAATSIWTRTTVKVDQFRESRAAFETITTRLSQATLNTYWDYHYDNPTSPTRIPQRYTRRSELRFISGPARSVLGPTNRERPTHCVFFQAPFGETETRSSAGGEEYAGFENLLCTWGYYLEFAGDASYRPDFIRKARVPQRYRYRLMELRQPAEENQIYTFTSGLDPQQQSYALRGWFTAAVNTTANSRVRVAAENVIAMIITPRLSRADEAAIRRGQPADYSPLAPDYLYDSAPTTAVYADARVNPVHQLPPLLQVTLVAIDEGSALRLNLLPTSRDPFQLRSEGRFTSTAKYSHDLFSSGADDSLENQLIRRGVNYRVFSTNVVIRGAKWSRETTN